jgi:hypothetical protein
MKNMSDLKNMSPLRNMSGPGNMPAVDGRRVGMGD